MEEDEVEVIKAMGDYFTAYRDLEKAAKDGLTKAIGVSNYFPSILVNLCERDVYKRQPLNIPIVISPFARRFLRNCFLT